MSVGHQSESSEKKQGERKKSREVKKIGCNFGSLILSRHIDNRYRFSIYLDYIK
jgi:hypothetical protein